MCDNLFRCSLLGATLLTGLHCGIAKADIDDDRFDISRQLPLPTGQFITPTAASGAEFRKLNPGLPAHPNFIANGAIKTAVSPDGTTLLVMTSGYNLLANAAGTANDAKSQYIFVYDIAGGNARSPKQKQVIQVPDTYVGLVWAPDNGKFYVSGGSGDTVYVYTGSTSAGWSQSASIPLGHASFAVGPFAPFAGLILNGIGFEEESTVAGLGLSADGKVLVAANIYNDSITVIDTATNTKRFEYDLRPYNTSGTPAVAGGETPFTVAVKGSTTAYVSSIRDREVVVVNITGTTPALIARIKLPGNPNSMILSADQSTLYATQDNSDTVAVIDTASNKVREEISTIAPPDTVPSGTKYTGAAANNLAISPDGKTLYVTNGAANSVAIIPLTGREAHTVSGLIPTAWYPNAVSLSHDGRVMYVANGKSDPGKNPREETASANQYVLQLEGGGLLTVPVPNRFDTDFLTAQVAANNGYRRRDHEHDHDAEVMNELRSKIKHVIYIIKENRTFDQILGDLTNGANGDPDLVMYGKMVTPNFHLLSQKFVTLDNFFCSGEVSGNGWAWSTEARESDHGTKSIPPNYAGRGASNDSEGTNRDINVGIATLAGRNAALSGLYGEVASALKGGPANLLPGNNDDFATDGPGGLVQAGHIWDAALRAGLTVRDYGFFIDISKYNLPIQDGGLFPAQYVAQDFLRNPFSLGLTVAISTNPALAPFTDPYFRGFDNAFPDVWRVEEWQREFKQYVTNGNLPNLTLLRLMHDHTGNFSGADTAVAGLTTPDLQQADNDLAVGRVVATLANSPYADNTLIFVLEDDAQDGPDHIDAHRSTAYIVGPYVKQHAVISKRYTTVNMVRTIEDVLGLDHLNLNDAYQPPMTDVFDLRQKIWNYSPVASPLLANTTIALNDPSIIFADATPMTPARDAAWWAEATRGLDFTAADRVPADLYNEIQWEGLKPGIPYPKERSGLDLRRRFVAEAAESK